MVSDLTLVEAASLKLVQSDGGNDIERILISN
jgi:hypothetical protein